MARILHIVGDSKFGGGSVLIERLAAEASLIGHDVSVLTTDITFQKRLKAVGVTVVDLDCIWRSIRPFRDFMGLLYLWCYLCGRKFDIIHTHTSKAGFIGRLAARFARVPVVVHTVHGFSFHEETSNWSLLVFSMLERIAALFCDAMVTVSRFHCNWAERLRIGNCQKRYAIPNGINADRIKPLRGRTALRKDLGFCEGEIMCLTTGRLVKQKGIDVLLKALHMMDDHIALRLIIVGDGEDRKKFEQMSNRFKISWKVVFLGFRTDVGDLLAGADIVVLPSLWEGLSISLLEAMAAGKAIITTNIGSNMEVIQDGKTALIVRSGNAKDLAETISMLSQDQKKREELGRNAFEEFNFNYREDIMLSRYMNLYSNLLIKKNI